MLLLLPGMLAAPVQESPAPPQAAPGSLEEGGADVAGWLESKKCIDSGKLLQCTKSVKSACPKTGLEEEGEEERTCIDSGKLLRCIRSVKIICPKY